MLVYGECECFVMQMLYVCVHPMAVLNAAFCMICSLLMLVEDTIGDHTEAPILIRLQMKTPSNPGLRRTYLNLNKANWDRYRQEVEGALSKHSFPTDCQRDEKIFRTVLLKAASHHRLHEEPVPEEILDVMNRDDFRKRDPT